jgi:hypothetical protein
VRVEVGAVNRVNGMLGADDRLDDLKTKKKLFKYIKIRMIPLTLY